MKTIHTYIAGIVLVSILLGFTSSYAAGDNYKVSKSISELCETAFKGEIDYDDKGCVFDETLSDIELLGNVTFTIKGKTYTSMQLQTFLDTAITKKYKKLGYKEGTPGMINAKSRFYDALLTKIGNDFSKKSTQNNNEKRELYAGLYLVLSVSKFKNGEDFAQASMNSYEQDNIKKYGSSEKPDTQYLRLESGEVVEVKLNIWEGASAKKIMSDPDYQQPTHDETNNPNIRYIDSVPGLKSVNTETPPRYQENYNAAVSQEGFMSTGIDQADIDRIIDAKYKAGIEDYQNLTDYEKQARRFNEAYGGISPSYNIHEKGVGEIQKLIDKVNQGPKTTGYIGMQNGLIYGDIVDSYNVYIGLLKDGGLVNYPPELVKETAFFREYVGPFYGDSNGQWRNGTTSGQNAEKVLNYFGYEIELDPLSPNYLELTYDESKNQAHDEIDYIDNIWK